MNSQSVDSRRKIIATVCALALCGRALAQQVPVPPTYPAVDANGVDLTTGQLVLPGFDLAIGSGQSGLSRISNENANSDSEVSAIAYSFIDIVNGQGPLTMDVSFGGGVMRFIVGGGSSRATATVTSNGPFSQMSGSATLVCTGSPTQFFSGGTCTATLGDGTSLFFGYSSTNGTLAPWNLQWNLQTLTKPDGEVLSYTYYSSGANQRAVKSVSSSLGWMFKYEVDASFSINKITAINTAVTYCDPLAASCSVPTSYPYVQATVAGSTTTRAINGVPIVAISAGTSTTTLTSPSGVVKAVSYTGGKVSAVAIGTSTWLYAYDAATKTTTVTNPDNSTHKIVLGLYGIEAEFDEKGAGREVSWDTNGSVQSAADWGTSTSRGTYTSFLRDSRGNIKTASLHPTDGGSPLTTTWEYPATCSNAKTCNKPLSVTTPDGIKTTYTYDPVHGGILTETLL